MPARARVRRPDGLARRAARGEPDRDAGGRRRPPDRRGRAAGARAAAARPRRAARARPAGVGAERGAGRLRRHVHLAVGGRAGARGRDARRRARRGARRDDGRSRSCARPAGRRRAPPTRSSSSRATASRDRPLGPRRARRPCWPSSGSSGPYLLASERHAQPRMAGSVGWWSELPTDRIGEVAAAASGLPTPTCSSRSAAAARSTRRRPSRRRRRCRVVSIPTTYSGAEWTPFFGVRDAGPADARRRRRRARSRAIVYEPELTLGLPRAETVGTALNALAHCAEALYVSERTPESDAHALEGASLIGKWLPHVVAEPDDLAGRTELLRGRVSCRRGARRLDARARPCARAGARRALRPAARRDERALPAAGAAVQRAGRAGRGRAVRGRARRRRRGRAGGGARAPRRLRAPARLRRPGGGAARGRRGRGRAGRARRRIRVR